MEGKKIRKHVSMLELTNFAAPHNLQPVQSEMQHTDAHLGSREEEMAARSWIAECREGDMWLPQRGQCHKLKHKFLLQNRVMHSRVQTERHQIGN
jgi:mRNA degradation ribonuclease J1/J2